MLKRKHSEMNASERVDQLLKDHRVIIFSKSYCPFCVKVSDHLCNFMNIFIAHVCSKGLSRLGQNSLENGSFYFFFNSGGGGGETGYCTIHR
jgi:hypothetical protein